MGYQLKPVTHENEHEFYGFMRANLAEMGAIYDDFHEGYQQAVSFGKALLFYHEGEAVGASVIDIRDDKRETYIEDIYIDVKARHQGHDRNLLRSCESLAAHFGQQSIGLICEPDLLPFYRKLGYDDSGVAGKNIAMKKRLEP